jgi:hypothetical protein
MKRWGVAVAGLYFLVLVVLSFPLALAAFWPDNGAGETLGLYKAWFYWAYVLFVVAGECLLLMVPVRLAEGRMRGRRPLLVPVITSALFFALLLFFFAWSLSLGLGGDKGLAFGLPDFLVWFVVGGVPALLWAVWAVLFHRFTRADSPESLTKRLMAWLLKGSILELLVAVPCHVAVRRRDDCCAPFGTFLGIAAGLSIMLMSFGPGVFLLFAERCRRLKPRAP